MWTNTSQSLSQQKKVFQFRKFKNSILMVVLILGTLMHHFSSFKLVKKPKKKSQSTTKDPIPVSDSVQKSKKYHSYDYEKK